MSGRTRLIARIALFSALIYVLSLGMAYLPNVKLSFFIIFSAGYLWGFVPGILVGAVGMGLWTVFNPYGPAPMPVALAQVFGGSLCGVVGLAYRGFINLTYPDWRSYASLITAGVICTILFFVPVSMVDAWLFQPFRERFITGILFSSWPLLVNIIIFPLLFGLLRPFYIKERNQRWH